MKSKFLILVFFYFLSWPIKAQTYFTVTPFFGIIKSFSKIESANNAVAITNASINFYSKYGFLIDLHKNKFTFSSGISLSRSATMSFSSNHSVYSQDVYVFAIPLLVSYATKEFNLFYIKRNNVFNENEDGIVKSNFFLMRFKLKPFAGLNIDFIDNMPSNTTSSIQYTYTETVKYSILNKNGISAMLGLTVQFMQRGKERLALNFYYNQGLTNYLNATYTYTENTISQTANVISKGTYMGMGISYPIKIWDADKQKRKI